MEFLLKRTEKEMGEREIKWGSKTLLGLDYADDLSITDENVSKINELFEVLRVQGERISWIINPKKTKSL